MSIITPKLNYARVRNTQRKNNKSIHELKDATNMRYNQPLHESDSHVIPTKQVHLNASDTNDIEISEPTSTFGQTVSSGQLEYINSLIKESKTTTANHNPRVHQSGLKTRSHQRTHSTRLELSHEHKPKQMHNENSFQNNPSLQTMCGTTQASSMKPDFVTEEENFRFKFGKGSPLHNRSHGGPHNTPTGKSGKLFDQFFKKDDLMRRSMSMEDLRFEKKVDRHLGHTSRDAPQVGWGRHSKISEVEDPLSEINGDFMSNLKGYINYFEKREESSSQSRQRIGEQYFVRSENRGKKEGQKELEAALKEVKALKKALEANQMKTAEIGKINKHLIKELSTAKLREEEGALRSRNMEKKIAQLSQRKDYYKAKLLQAEELLAIERIDNENNLIALKKVLSNNIGNALDTHMVCNTTKQDRSQREEEYIRSILKDGGQSHQKKSKDKNAFSGVKVTKSSKGDLRYDLPLNSQAKKKKSKESFIYDNSAISKKAGGREDERISLKDESVDLSGSSQRFMEREDLEERFHHERKQEIIQSGGSNKILSKNQQIKLLQERLAELAGENDLEYSGYEQEHAQKSGIKHKSKFAENHRHQQGYFPLRERENSFLQVTNPQMRYEYYMNVKGRENMENDPSMDETSHFGQSMNENGY